MSSSIDYSSTLELSLSTIMSATVTPGVYDAPDDAVQPSHTKESEADSDSSQVKTSFFISAFLSVIEMYVKCI